MTNSFYLLVLSLLFNSTAFSQCGTVVPRDHVMEPMLMDPSMRDQIESEVGKTLSVSIYIVANGPDQYNYGAADYTPFWAELNEIFTPIDLQFIICSETLIPNYHFDELSREVDPDIGMSEADGLYAQYYQTNTINVYYIKEVTDEPEVDGYAALPPGLDIIVLRKEHGPATLPHEMGHYMGLYHTFEMDFGLELVSGDNCTTAGDLICDTPADYNGLYENCTYSGQGTDANGEYYTPYLSNYMSYYVDCSCKFTNGQYNRMAWSCINLRSNLW